MAIKITNGMGKVDFNNTTTIKIRTISNHKNSQEGMIICRDNDRTTIKEVVRDSNSRGIVSQCLCRYSSSTKCQRLLTLNPTTNNRPCPYPHTSNNNSSSTISKCHNSHSKTMLQATPISNRFWRSSSTSIRCKGRNKSNCWSSRWILKVWAWRCQIMKEIWKSSIQIWILIKCFRP